MPTKTYTHLRPGVHPDVADAVSRSHILDSLQGYSDRDFAGGWSHATSELGTTLENRVAGLKHNLHGTSASLEFQALVALWVLSPSLSEQVQHTFSNILKSYVQERSTEESAQIANELYSVLQVELLQKFRLIMPQGQEMSAHSLSTERQEPLRLANELHAAFEAEPLEDGMSHPAELVIEKALQSMEGAPVLDWLKSLCLDVKHPAFSASVLRCLGRQTDPGDSEWRYELVREALSLDNVEIRDAAVQSAELWDDKNLADVLESHNENEPWLCEYIEEILKNWSD